MGSLDHANMDVDPGGIAYGFETETRECGSSWQGNIEMSVGYDSRYRVLWYIRRWTIWKSMIKAKLRVGQQRRASDINGLLYKHSSWTNDESDNKRRGLRETIQVFGNENRILKDLIVTDNDGRTQRSGVLSQWRDNHRQGYP